MKREISRRSVSRRDPALFMSVSEIMQYAAQKLYALQFYFYVYFFTCCPIRQNCPG